jgi:hypothetical protein
MFVVAVFLLFSFSSSFTPRSLGLNPSAPQLEAIVAEMKGQSETVHVALDQYEVRNSVNALSR